ncbi:MAG TPA: HDOD domain-containing protein [Acidobacteriaceae bacterium]|jgi:EAL and modified HD-GYP domain-containing signal transduction protein|nr:HDOD domain-containing protein [Acidobacteriaceae bacterium]
MPSVASVLKSTVPPAAAPHAPITTPNRFLGRQPILDAERHLFGYELLFRAGKENVFSGDADEATREVIDHWLLLIPESNRTLSFVNCTRNALVDGLVTLLPPESTVLEVPENIDPDAELLESCLQLKQQGYRMALDGFLPRASRTHLLHLADFIKVDFLTAGHDTRQEIYRMAAGTGARLLAEKVETDIQQRIAVAEGCTLFQGYFFSQPVLLASHAVPQNYFVYLKLLTTLTRDPVDLRKVEKLLSGDASLCYRILRLANSAMQGHPSEISTIREALMMVGESAVRRMVTVAMAGAMASDRSSALLSLALSRAAFCELMAPFLSGEPSQFYLLGILSLLDVLLETSIERILESVPITLQMKAALLGDTSGAGRILDLVRSLEGCDWQRCEQIQQQLGLGEGLIAATYAQSLRWASTMVGQEIGS